MAKKKEAEGIALLSMYNDEDMDVDDDDEEEEEGEEEEEDEEEEEQQQYPQHQEDHVNVDADDSPENRSDSDSENPTIPPYQSSIPDQDDLTPIKSPELQSQPSHLPSPSPPPPPPPPLSESDVQRIRKGPLVIVDYAHDETAMSPEAEEGEILSTGRVMFGEEFPNANGNFQEKTPPGTVHILTPNLPTTSPSSQAEQQKFDAVKATSYTSPREPEAAQITEVDDKAAIEGQKENLDPLEKFLPPPPSTKCSVELQERICKYLSLKRSGRSFNEDLRNSKGYRNPDFLQHAVSYQDIDQIGTCFSKDVFDPHGYDKSDYYDEIEEADMKREMEKREQEKKRNQRVDFIQGGTQPGSVLPAPKVSTQIPAATVSGLHSVPIDARDSRQNKKTKWDKVDTDKRNPLPSGGQDALSAAGAHAALLSAANAGAGYTAFAQQKRREAEEKRSSERKLEKRS